MHGPGTKRSIMLVLTMAILLSMTAGSFNGTQGARAQGGARYIALGDSIAAGLSSSLPRKRGYPALVGDMIEQFRQPDGSGQRIDVFNLAVPGETTSSFIDNGQLDSFIEMIDQAEENGNEVALITLTLGGNDLIALEDVVESQRETEFEEFHATFGAIMTTLQEQAARVEADLVVTTYYDLSAGDASIEGSDPWWAARFNDAIRTHAEDAGARIADVAAAFDNEITDLTRYPADIHPNNEGHRVIAREIWKTLAYDDQAPDIEIQRPGEGVLLSHVPTVRVAVIDASMIDSVELLIDGEVIREMLYLSKENIYIAVWDSRETDQVTVTLSVRATDLAGNTATESIAVGVAGE